MNEVSILMRARPRAVERVPNDAPWPPAPPPRAVPPLVPPAPATAQLEALRAERGLLETALAGIREAVRDAERQRQQHMAQWQEAAVELALSIAARLCYEQLEAGQFPLEAMVREMAAPFVGASSLSVHMNPADIHVLRERLGEQPLLEGGDGSVRLAEDSALARGDCRVEDGDQVLVSQLAAKLRAIRDEMHGEPDVQT